MATTGKKIDTAFLYRQISDKIEQLILSGNLRFGNKLPSIRVICNEYGVNPSTALQAYLQLEKKALIRSRPRSGYYVSYIERNAPTIRDISRPGPNTNNDDNETLTENVFSTANKEGTVKLSVGLLANELLPIAKLNKGLSYAMRQMKGSGTGFDLIQGNEKLRRQIVRFSSSMGGKLGEDDLITTAGCSNALFFSLLAVTEKGDTIGVESPAYFGIFLMAKSIGLNVLELPTHPETGIVVEDFEKAIKKGKIKACILVSNFNNPLGSLMPDSSKKVVVEMAEKYGVPIIEDDIYGDLYFGLKRPKSCKAFDESGNVLWCSSVSKILAPGYRVGWVEPGRYKQKVLRLKYHQSLTSTTITQEVIAYFLETGRYENHLRKLRQTLHANSLQFIRSIGEYFPEGTLISRPQGGFMLWLELDKKINTVELFDKAIQQKISIAPGKIFTMQDQYNNCMRLSFGLVWNEHLEGTLKNLGKIAKTLSTKR